MRTPGIAGLLLAGVYAEPDYFRWAVEGLNAHGLLATDDDCKAVFRKYVELSTKDIVEPLADEAIAMSVKVFAVAP